MNSVRTIPLSQINPDPAGIQPRSSLDQDAVNRYADDIREGTNQPAIELIEIQGEDKYRIADGYHRFAAHQAVKKTSIRAIVREGTMVDAKEAALEHNTRHGVPLSSENRRLALLDLLEEYQKRGIQRSTRDLAKIAGMPKSTVHRIAKEFVAEADQLIGLPEEPDKPKSPIVTHEGGSECPNGTPDQPENDGDEQEELVDPDGEINTQAAIIMHDSSIIFRDIKSHITKVKSQVLSMSERAGGEALARHATQLERAITDIRSIVVACTPERICERCEGSGEHSGQACPVCKGTRVLFHEKAKQVSDDHKTGLRPRGSVSTPTTNEGADW